jgi:hypothetical protein
LNRERRCPAPARAIGHLVQAPIGTDPVQGVSLNRAGDYRSANRADEATAKRIRRYAGHDPELRAVVAGLEREVGRFEAPMAPAALKVAYAGASYAMRSRDFDGKALKRPTDLPR